jgi:hypothetical protein
VVLPVFKTMLEGKVSEQAQQTARWKCTPKAETEATPHPKTGATRSVSTTVVIDYLKDYAL